MIALRADEIARLTGGRLVGDGDAVVTGPVVVDSRLVQPGGLFVAFAGVWILFSTLIAPAAISKAVATGAQVGTALLGGTATAATAATVAGARGASAVSSMGSSPSPPPPSPGGQSGSASAGGMSGTGGLGGGSIAGAATRASQLKASS